MNVIYCYLESVGYVVYMETNTCILFTIVTDTPTPPKWTKLSSTQRLYIGVSSR